MASGFARVLSLMMKRRRQSGRNHHEIVVRSLSSNSTSNSNSNSNRSTTPTLTSKPQSFQSSFLTQLLLEPMQRITTILDSQLNSTILYHHPSYFSDPNNNNNNLSSSSMMIQTLDISWEDILKGLVLSSPKKAQMVLQWRFGKLREEKKINPKYCVELINLCGKIQDVRMATNVFASMLNEGLEPTAEVFNSLIYVCLSSEDFMRARNLFEIMKNSESYKPNSDTYNAFILTYLKLGNLVKMYSWYSAKTAAGFSSDFQTYQLLILEAIKFRKPTYAHKCFKGMLSQGIMPDIDTLQPLLLSLCDARRFSNVSELVKSIIDGGWEINVTMAKKLVWFYSAPHCKQVMEQLVLYVKESNQALEVQSLFHLGLIRMYAKE